MTSESLEGFTEEGKRFVMYKVNCMEEELKEPERSSETKHEDMRATRSKTITTAAKETIVLGVNEKKT
eukprot:6176970-Pleurochrysis_carterae.AAC.2